MPLPHGHKLGPYEIIAPLGAGGMGEVYRARDSKLGRDVALKVLPPEVTVDPVRLQRFDREARAIAALNHPNIVTIFATEDIDNVRFITMELVEGHTLNELIVSKGIPVAKFLEIAIPMADAIAAAHQKQITHRDLKPGNVMVSHEGRVKVLDFGLARMGGHEAVEHSVAATQAPITHRGMIVGTMPYMSPEQVEGRQLDARTDLFSLGVMFYEMLNGARPFSGASSPALMSSILRDTPSSISERRDDVPEALDRLISRMLEKRPEDRIQTARDVYNELRHISNVRSHDRSSVRSEVRSNVRSNDRLNDRANARTVIPVIVRPFVAASDPLAAEVAEGLSIDLAAALARFWYVRVLDRGAERSARYRVEGDVRASSGFVRVSVRVVDETSGAQVWAQKYDNDAATGAFAIVDEVTARVAATCSGAMMRAFYAAAAAEAPPTPWARFNQYISQPTHAEHAALREAFEQVVAANPDSVGYEILAVIYGHEAFFGFNPRPNIADRVRDAATRAVAIDPTSQFAWLARSLSAYLDGDTTAFLSSADQTLEINPLSTTALVFVGFFLVHMGEVDRGAGMIRRALTLNPNLQRAEVPLGLFVEAYEKGDADEALKQAKRSAMLEAPFFPLYALAAAGKFSRPDDARATISAWPKNLRELLDPQRARAALAPWVKGALLDHLLDGITKALSFDDRDHDRAHGPEHDRSHDRAHDRSHARDNDRSSGIGVVVRAFQAGSDPIARDIAEGVTADIATHLAKFSYVRVMRRGGSDPGSGPGAYSIEGDVRVSGKTVRVSVRLIDAATGVQAWGRNFDRDTGVGVFAIVDDVASRVAATVADTRGELIRAYAATRGPGSYISGRFGVYTARLIPEEHAALRDELEAFVQREPGDAHAWAYLSILYCHEAMFGLNERPDVRSRARQAANRAISIDANLQIAWMANVQTASVERDEGAFLTAVDRAIDLNPLNTALLAGLASFLAYAGHTGRAADLSRRALDLNPHDPGWHQVPIFLDAYMRGKSGEAMELIRRIAPTFALNPLFVVAATGRAGLAAEAQAAILAWKRDKGRELELDSARDEMSRLIWDRRLLDSLVDGVGAAMTLAPASGSHHTASIAVLPFADLSPAKDQDWFCDGIAEEILNALSPLPGLRVAARASAFSFKGKSDDLRAIGEKLNVTTVLEGSVRRAGNRVRITAQLSDAREGRQLWSERFDRELQDIFDVQDEIARAIVDRLRLTLGSDAGKRLVPKATANLEAYELLLKGRVLLTRRGPGIVNAIECFEKAIALDPNLADAHAGLGDTYRLMGIYTLMPGTEALPLARASLDRALAIDPNQVEALATLANITHAFSWDYADAMALSDRVLALDPSHVRALAESAITIATGLIKAPSPALRQRIVGRLERARAIDPLNAWVMAVEGLTLPLVGSVNEAVAAAERAVATDPANFTGHWAHVAALAVAGRRDEALRAAEAALTMSRRHAFILAEVAAIRADDGDSAAAGAIYQELSQRAAGSYVSIGLRAGVAASAGRVDESRALLAQALAARDPYLSFWKYHAFSHVLKDDACMALLRASKLWSYSEASS